MTQLPPEHPDTDALAADWRAMLGGDAPTTGAVPALSTGATPVPGRPMTRREIREAEQRAAAQAEAESVAAPAAAGATPSPQPVVPAMQQQQQQQQPLQPLRQPQTAPPLAEPSRAPQPAAPAQPRSAFDAHLAGEAPPVVPRPDLVPTSAAEHAPSASPFADLLGDPHQSVDTFADSEPVRRKPSRAERRAAASGPYDHDHDHDEKPRRRGAWGCLIGLLIVAALGAGAFFFLQRPINALIERFEPAADYEGAGTGELVFMIHEGDTGESIGANLVDADVVASTGAFLEAVAETEPSPVFYPGAYQLAEQMSAQAALDALLDPANKLENTFVIPEGTATVDALTPISEGTGIPVEELQAAAAEPPASYGLPAEATNLEGFLFPATYTLDPNLDAHAVLQTLVDRQFQALDEAGVAPEDRWKTIVLAALVQREAGLKDDFYKVSRVFLNRLDPAKWESGLLESDATVAYGTGNTHLVTTTDEERADPANRYNTYVHPGLPVGPISNPGDLAIDAAVHPADGPWLFFVTWNLDTGETIFSETIEQHDAAVEKWLAWMEEHPEYG
ncbi:endolytic transglycosylase MltG [Agromyces italicus]|uniref:endolytic transglycosylase MltG n=1 Tax=Agromyces italicus TaxID=279572 RepID=UPI0003B4E28A|nr:endolytic transglycosylase MltG [Agromyces italicus]